MPYRYPSLLSRGLWLKIHWYLALCFGGVFIVLSLSGAALLFADGLDALLNPRLAVAPSIAPLPPDRLMAAARVAHPDRHGEWVLESPLHTAEALGIWGPPLWFCASFAPLLLLATGLAQWLIRRGMLADRAVDFSRWPYFWDQQRPLINKYGASFAYNLLRAFH
jgi:uncharacterized iron-regulated membrane protein